MILIRVDTRCLAWSYDRNRKKHVYCFEPLDGDMVEYVDLDLHPELDEQIFC